MAKASFLRPFPEIHLRRATYALPCLSRCSWQTWLINCSSLFPLIYRLWAVPQHKAPGRQYQLIRDGLVHLTIHHCPMANTPHHHHHCHASHSPISSSSAFPGPCPKPLPLPPFQRAQACQGHRQPLCCQNIPRPSLNSEMLDIFLHSSFPGLTLPLVAASWKRALADRLPLSSLRDLLPKPLPWQVMKLSPEKNGTCAKSSSKGTPQLPIHYRQFLQ